MSSPPTSFPGGLTAVRPDHTDTYEHNGTHNHAALSAEPDQNGNERQGNGKGGRVTRQRRKVSGFKRDSPNSYHEFVHSRRPSAETKKRSADHLREESGEKIEDGGETEMVVISSPEKKEGQVMEKKEANGKKLESRDSGVDVGGANESKSGVSTAVFKARSRRVQRYPFPKSAPVEHKEKADDVLKKAQLIFSAQLRHPTSTTPTLLSEQSFTSITTTACGFPRFLNRALWTYCHDGHQIDSESEGDGGITYEEFEKAWNKLVDEVGHGHSANVHALVFEVLRKGREGRFLVDEDFRVIVEDVVHNHPGLEFLRDGIVFQKRYVETVITRIFYDKTHNTIPKMTLREFRKDRLLETIRNLEDEEDVNTTRTLFSYKHFYVIYCKFWELDTDHDLFISLNSLLTYAQSAISPTILSRVFSGAGRGTMTCDEDRMFSYQDFIWFILAVEDKSTSGAIEYWFRCLDLDGDGVISLWELKGFWEEQLKRMDEWRVGEGWKWEDFLCAMIDMINPATPHQITLPDLKRCRSASALVFDMLFDIRKYDLHLRRIDPGFREWDDMWIVDRDGTRVKLEGWDKFAERAYEELAFDESQGSGSGSSSSPSSPRVSYTSTFYMDESDLWEDDGEDDGPGFEIEGEDEERDENKNTGRDTTNGADRMEEDRMDVDEPVDENKGKES